MTAAAALSLDRDGAERRDGAGVGLLSALASLAERHEGAAGIRLAGDPLLAAIVAPGGPIQAIAAARLGAAARAVRAVLFDKSPAANWALGWHQDRTIAVAARHEVPGYGPWTLKQGLPHVEPPFAVIEAMLTLRFHLDRVPADNAPLLIAPGSHRLGRIPVTAIDDTVARCDSVACLADPGDVWVYATPILHASARAGAGGRRRVLQVDFSADALPPPLAWLGV